MYIYTIEQYKNDKFMNCSYKQHVNGCGKHNIEWLKIDLKNTKWFHFIKLKITQNQLMLLEFRY